MSKADGKWQKGLFDCNPCLCLCYHTPLVTWFAICSDGMCCKYSNSVAQTTNGDCCTIFMTDCYCVYPLGCLCCKPCAHREKVARAYNINDHSGCMKTCYCYYCSANQVIEEIKYQEGLKFGCMGSVTQAGTKPPKVNEMQRANSTGAPVLTVNPNMATPVPASPIVHAAVKPKRLSHKIEDHLFGHGSAPSAESEVEQKLRTVSPRRKPSAERELIPWRRPLNLTIRTLRSLASTWARGRGS